MAFLDTVLQHAAMLEQWTLCSLEDIPSERFTEQPGGLTNHPAWIVGHLAYAMDNVTVLFDAPPARDDAWHAPFKGGTAPTAERDDYPSKDELLAAFGEACQTLRRVVREAGEAALTREIEGEMRPFLPTLGRWVAHALLTEVAFHTGQLSAWRRASGLPSVFEVEANAPRMMAAHLQS